MMSHYQTGDTKFRLTMLPSEAKTINGDFVLEQLGGGEFMETRNKAMDTNNKAKDIYKIPARLGKIFIAINLIIVLMYSLSGCAGKHTQSGVRDFVVEKCGLKNFAVSDEPKKAEDKYRNSVLLWDITLGGKEKIVFHVWEDYGWVPGAGSNSLFTDCDDVMLRYYFESYNGFTNFKLDTSMHGETEWNEIYASYTDRDSLHKRLDELNKFHDFVISKGFQKEYSMRYNLLFENPLRHNVEDDVEDGDFSGFVTSFDDEDRITAEQNYLYACIDYRFENHLLKFTKEEIKTFVKEQKYRIGISRGDKNYVYDDLLPSKFGYGISFGTLFEILKREGLEVKGNSWKYSYIDERGNKYDFSYDFFKQNPEDPEGKVWYFYLKNGEPVWMDAYFYNHLHEYKIAEITGLKLDA